MDTGNYQYSQYQSSAGYDATGNTYSAGQSQSQNMTSQQPSGQSGMMSQQPSGQSGTMSQQPSGQSSGQTGMMGQQSGSQSGMVSQQPGTMSQQSGRMAPQSGVMSDQTGMAQQWGPMSQQSGTVPQQTGVMPQQTGVMSQQAGTMSQQTGTMPQQTGMMPQQSGMMSQQSGMMPQQSGMMSQQSGMMSQQSGMMSQQSGMMSQQSGMMSQQSGMWNNNMSGSSDVQQSQGSWMAPQQDNLGNLSTDDTNSYSHPSDNYSMYQSTSNYTQAQAPDKFGGSSMQNNSGSQQYGNMSGGMMSGYDQGSYGYSQQDTSSNFNEQQSNFQGNNSQSNFQGNNSQTNFQGNNPQSNFQGTNNPQSNFQGTNNSQSNFQGNNPQTNFKGTNNSQSNFQGNNAQSNFQRNNNFQGNNSQSNFQGNNNPRFNFQGNNNPRFNFQGANNYQFQQGLNSGYNYGNTSMQSGGYSSGFQQGNGGNFNNKPFNYQNNNGVNNQQNMGSQFQQSRWKNPSAQQTKPFGFNQQQGPRPFMPRKNFNDPAMNQFYNEIGGPNQQPPKKKSRFDQKTASVPTFADPQHSIGQRLNEKAIRRPSGQVFMGQGSKAQESDASLTPIVNNASQFDDDDTEHCKLCNAFFTSAPMYALHVRGLAHIQRRMAVEFGNERSQPDKPYIVSGKNYTQTAPQNKKLTGFGQSWEDGGNDGGDVNKGSYCEVCDIYVDNERMLWRHRIGMKHRKTLKAQEEGNGARPGPGQLEDESSKKARQLMNTPVPENQLSAINFAFDSVPPEEPVVGLAFLVEKIENMNQVFGCQLCKTQGNLYNMVQHTLGTRHRINYLKVRDRERYQQLNQQANRKEITAQARQLCVELENLEGRGTARYNGPPRRLPQNRSAGRDATPTPEHLQKYEEQQALMSENEKKLAIESLKRTLLEDFMKRNIDPDTATKILNSRMELLAEYEKRGVPFVLARERVIEEEERWNLLLEFERQVLSFEEAEQRIDHRFELMKMYEKNGYPNEEARRKVLDDEVIYDFKRDFVRLGLKREEAQNLAEKRLWMLEQFHYQNLSPEDASEKVIAIEHELKKSIKAMLEDNQQHARRRRESKPAQWMVAGEELEKYVLFSCKELSLNFDQREEQVSIALEAFDRYRRQGGLLAIEAKVLVLANDLPIPRPASHTGGPDEPMESEPANDPGSKVDIKNRILQFKSKMDEALQVTESSSTAGPSPEISEAEKEKRLAEYDQQSRVEIQTVLADMLKMKIPPDEARKILVSLYKQHENLREQFFPSKKFPSSSSKASKTGEAAASKEPQSSAADQPKEKPAATDDTPAEKSSEEKPAATDDTPAEKSSEEKPAATNDTPAEKSSKESTTAEKQVVEMENKSGDVQADGKTTEVTEDQTKLNKNDPSKDGSGKAQEEKKETTAVDRWESSVEMFLQQYGLTRDQYRTQAMRKRGEDKDRYSPSQLSPKRSRSRSPGRGRKRPPSRSPSSRSRSPGRGRKRPPSRSPSRWKRMFNSETRPRSPGRDRRGPSSGGWFPSQRSRYSPRPRSPARRYSPGTWSSSSRRSPGPRSSSSRRSPGPRYSRSHRSGRSPFSRWSPSSRRSPGRRSSPDMSRPLSPLQSWGRPAEFDPLSRRRPRSRDRDHESERRRRPRWERGNRTPEKDEPGFNFAGGVWPDVDDVWD